MVIFFFIMIVGVIIDGLVITFILIVGVIVDGLVIMIVSIFRLFHIMIIIQSSRLTMLCTFISRSCGTVSSKTGFKL